MPRRLCYLCITLLAGVCAARAQTWTGATGSTWSTRTNWSTNTAPANDGTADIAFANSSRLAVTLDQPYRVNSLTFTSSDTGAYALSGTAALSFGAGGITNNSANASGPSIDTPIILMASQTWNATAGPITYGSGANATSTLNTGGATLTIDGTSNTSINAPIIGAGALTKVGGGALILGGTASNTFTGTTTVSQGLLYLTKSTADAAIPGNLVIGDSSSPANSAVVAIGVGTTAEQLVSSAVVTVNASGVWYVGTQSISKLTINGGTVFVNPNGTGILSLSNGLTMSGGTLSNAYSNSGQLILGGDINVSGSSQGSAVGTSTLDLSGVTRTLNVARGTSITDLDLGSLISNGALIKNGSGVLSLGQSNTFQGGFTLNAGTVMISGGTPFGTGTLTINGGAVTPLGGSTVVSVANRLVLNGDLNIGGYSGVTFTGDATLTASRVIAVDQVGGFSGHMDDGGAGYGITKNGAGTLLLAGANSFSGPVTVNAGTLQLGHPNALGTGPTTVNAGASLDLLGTTTAGARVLSLAGTGNNQNGALLNSASTAATWGGSISLAGPATIAANSGTLNVSGPISGTAALTVDGFSSVNLAGTLSLGVAGITKTGYGALTLQAANNYTGQTLINGGSVVLGNALALGSSMGGTILGASGGALDLHGQNVGAEPLTINGAGGYPNPAALYNGSSTAASFAGPITLGSDTTVKALAGDLILNGTVSGTGNLTVDGSFNSQFTNGLSIAGGLNKYGTGTLFLGGASSYGNTYVSAGILRLLPGGSFSPGGTLDVAAGASVDLNGNDAATAAISDSGTINLGANTLSIGAGDGFASFTGVLKGAGGLVKTGAGKLILYGNNTYSGPTLVTGGTLQVHSVTALSPSTAISVNPGGALDLFGFTLSNNQPLSLSGNGVSAGGALTNSASSAATWPNGIILTGAATIAPAFGSLTISGSVQGPYLLTVDGSAATTLSGVVATGAGGLSKLGSGTLLLQVANTYTGATTISSGILKLGDPAALGVTPGNTTIQSGGTLDLNGLAVGGETVSLTGAGYSGAGVLTNSSAAAASLSGSVTLTGASSVKALAGSLSLIGGVSGNATLTMTGTADMLLQGAVNLGSGGLSKQGAGTLTLGAVGNYSGATTVSGGTLRLASGAVLPTAATLTVATGATFDLNSVGVSTGGLTGAGSVVLGSATLSVGGNSGTSTFSGIISGSGGLMKTGAGTQILSGANTFSGPVTVSGGILKLAVTTALASTSGVLVSPGAALDVNGMTALAFPLTIGGSGPGGGAIVNSAGTAGTLSGRLSLASASTIYASGTVVLKGGIDGSFPLTIDGPGTVAVTSGMTTGSAGLTKNGAGGLNFSGAQANTYTGLTVVNAGSLGLVKSAIAISGDLLVGDGVGGANADIVRLFAANQTAPGINVTVASSGLFDTNGNRTTIGSMAMSGGAVSTGSGSLSITGDLSLSGMISSTLGGNVNVGGKFNTQGNATLTGVCTVAAGGVNGGALTFSGGAAAVLSIAGGQMTNAGTINLNAASITGAGTLRNNAGATVSGAGAIGTDLLNSGLIEAAGGTMTLGGSVSNTSAGQLLVDNGAKILITNGLSVNDGAIGLIGGTFDNSGQPLNNNGQMNGNGTWRVGVVTNNGSITFSGGATSFNGGLTNAAGRTVSIVQSVAAFSGSIVNNGAFLSDGSSQSFSSLSISASGYLAGGASDLFSVAGDLTSRSLQSSLWNTSGSEIDLTGALLHQLTWTGADLGRSSAGFTNNFAIGTLLLSSGASLNLLDGDATPGGAIYVHALLLGDGLAQIASLTDNGLSIYYDPSNPANGYLLNGAPSGTYQLADGGLLAPALMPVPEPCSFVLLLLSASLVLGMRRVRSRSGVNG